MTYFESPYCKVSWNAAIEAVVVEWKTFAKGDNFRIPMEKARELTALKKSKKWLYDSRKLAAMHQDDQDWNSNDFHPRNIKAGMRYLATITPEKVTAGISLSKVISGAENVADFEHQQFTSVEDAIKWLSQK